MSLRQLLVLSAPFLATAWECILIQETPLVDGVFWQTHNCTVSLETSPPLLVVNSVHVDLTRDDLRLVPAVATAGSTVSKPHDDDDGSDNTGGYLQDLPSMAAQDPNFIAGINGGYFWRVDVDGFWRDNVCRGKLRKEAERPPNPDHPNFGVGDGVVIIDGVLHSSNCNCTGYSRPAVLTPAGIATGITVYDRAGKVPEGTQNAIGAGPQLVSFDSTQGVGVVDIPQGDDNINRLVYEAQTAVGLVQTPLLEGGLAAQTAVLVTVDGSDSCKPNEHYCGVEARNLASLMIEQFNCTSAMSMDQGGSTTMWIKGMEPSRNGVVSRSDNTDPSGGGARNIANGLFVQLLN